MAPTRGFEPPTYRLGGGRSILLSYVGPCCDIVNENWSRVKEKPVRVSARKRERPVLNRTGRFALVFSLKGACSFQTKYYRS